MFCLSEQHFYHFIIAHVRPIIEGVTLMENLMLLRLCVRANPPRLLHVESRGIVLLEAVTSDLLSTHGSKKTEPSDK